MILSQNFFNRPALKVAENLIGKFLVRKYRGREIVGMITEVEAYDGPHDKASHASRGMTERNKIMFGPAGCFYVYLIYGTHWMLNVVVGEEGYPAAVLIRGVSLMRTNKGTNDTNRIDSSTRFTINRTNKTNRTDKAFRLNGPGKLTKFLMIDKKFNGRLAAPKNGLWFEDRGIIVPKSEIERTLRVGVHYAEEWAEKPYRFRIKN